MPKAGFFPDADAWKDLALKSLHRGMTAGGLASKVLV